MSTTLSLSFAEFEKTVFSLLETESWTDTAVCLFAYAFVTFLFLYFFLFPLVFFAYLFLLSP